MKNKVEVITPLGDRVLIKPNDKEEKSKGGIIIPETARVKPQRGVVIAVGEKTTVKKGDVVLYGKFDGVDVGDGLKIMMENLLIAVVTTK